MKKVLLFGLMALGLSQVKAQDAVMFKMKYSPNHKYASVFGIGVDLNLNATGNQAIIDKIKSQGITLPVEAKLNIGLNADINTGTTAADKSFPVLVAMALQDLSIEFGGNKIEPLKGKNVDIKIYGHNHADGTMAQDSAVVNGKKDTSGSSVSNVLSSLQKQIKFPDHALKIGESFTQDSPMKLPTTSKLSITATKMEGKTTYKLTAIADGKAYFDIVQNMDIEMNIKGATVKLSGEGTGKLVYSIKDNYPLSLNDVIKMKLNVTVATLVVDGTADVTVTSTNTIN